MSEELHKDAPPKNFNYARENRKGSTKPEEILWEVLRNRKLYGYKFRRQHPISDFIADFYCHECRLIIEIDGKYHHAIEQKQYDDGRTIELMDLKVRLIRFTNKDVFENIEYVIEDIKANILKYQCDNDREDIESIQNVFLEKNLEKPSE